MRAFPLAILVLCSTARAQTTAPAAPDPAAPAASQPPGAPTDAAAVPAQPPVAATAEKKPQVSSKWDLTLYGFAELDTIYDSTESFTDIAGNGAIARPSAYAGRRPRTQFSIRNSRLGFRLAAPESHGVRASAQIETDFFGNAPPAAGQTSGGVSEGGFFTSPGLRVRHAFLRVETPVVDVLAGQFWQLFGWQGMFQPNTVQPQGIPGEIYSRAPQVRISKTLKTAPVSVELAIAASRPPQRDAGLPDGQAGLKLTVNDWKGVHTMGSTGTAADGLTIGVSGVGRRFALIPPSGGGSSTWATGWGYSIDALVPVVPGSLKSRGNALTVTASFVQGRGINDLYTGLTGGLASPNAYGKDAPAVDPGLVAFDAAGSLQPVRWQSFIVGAQYYLPPSGNVWVAVNYSQMKSDNAASLIGDAANAAKVFSKSAWYDANLFWDATDAVRLGVEYSRYDQTYVDHTKVNDDRVVLSGFYLF